MDGSMIDRLAQMLQRASRRHALRMALGGVAVATAGMVAFDPGSDAKKRRKRCKKRVCRALPVGVDCEANVQCCPNETNRICAFAEELPGPLCCGVRDAACSSGNECCRGFVCFDERCAFAG